MDNQNLTNFDLNSETIDLIFEAVGEQLTYGLKSGISPHLALIVGQPGAGKSTILDKIVDEFGAENLPVVYGRSPLSSF
ncbi:MAG: zeta toxin family protein [Bdellovibrionales bacterium]